MQWIQNFVDIHLKQEDLDTYGLPNIAYPVPMNNFDAAMRTDGKLPFAEMLHGLQQRSRNGQSEWQHLEPAIDRLAQLIAPQDDREVISAAGDHWWLEFGPVDLNAKLVTIQRGDSLIAAIVNKGDGRLRVAVFRPLDAKSAEYLIGLGQTPHPQYGVSMRENNWEYALDCSAGTGNSYAHLRGEPYLSYWENGIGISHDDTVVYEWRVMKDLIPREAVLAVTELGVHCSFSSTEQDDSDDKLNDEVEYTKAKIFPMWNRKRQQPRTVRGKFFGCLLGGAVGDALGASIEFMDYAEIITRFGPTGITHYAPAYGALGTITDDTQMTMFTAEGMLRAVVRRAFKGVSHVPSVVAHAYLRWLFTQGERPVKNFDDIGDGWLFQQTLLHNRRAPGNTCLSALKSMKAFGDPASNDSKGCGGVMRMAPVGLMAWSSDECHVQKAFQMGIELAALTHGHPTGTLSSGTLAVLILVLVDGACLRDGLATVKALLRYEARHEETLCAIEEAEALAATTLPSFEAITKLGQGWVAEEALAISIYCALVARDFRQGILLAVNHDGDSDSTGSITGNLLGAMYGMKAIPATLLEHLELREVIAELAEDLYTWRCWDIGEYSKDEALNEHIWKKYPGW